MPVAAAPAPAAAAAVAAAPVSPAVAEAAAPAATATPPSTSASASASSDRTISMPMLHLPHLSAPQFPALASASRSALSTSSSWLRAVAKTGFGRLSPLPPATQLEPAAAAALQQQASQMPSEALSAPVPLAEPVLAVQVLSADGPLSRDVRILHPSIRLSLVDLATGRLLAPQQRLVAGGGEPVKPEAVAIRCGCWGGAAASSDSSSSSSSSGPGDVYAGKKCQQLSAVCLNRSLASDAATLAAAAAGQNEALGSHDGTLVWRQTLVFPVPLSHLVSPCPTAAIFFELLDMPSDAAATAMSGSSKAQSTASNARPVGWGYLRLCDASGHSRVALSARVPMGAPQRMLPAFDKASATLHKLTQVPRLQVQLFPYVPITTVDRWVHAATLPAAVAPAAVPVPLAGPQATPTVTDAPDVVIQYRLANRKPLPASLQVRAFGALIPAQRLVRTHEYGVTHTFLTASGAKEAAHAAWATLLQHPATLNTASMLHLVPLPTDVNEKDTAASAAEDAAAAAAAAAALEASASSESGADGSGGSGSGSGGTGSTGADSNVVEEDISGNPTAAPRISRIMARGSNEPCVVPGSVVGTLPTSKTGATAVCFSPSGAHIAVACLPDTDGAYPIRVFETQQGREVARLVEHTNIVYTVSWSSDGCWLLSASGDGTAIVWSAGGLKKRLAPGRPRMYAYSRLAHTPPSYVYAAKFHPAMTTCVVTGSYDHGLRLWDARLPPAGAEHLMFTQATASIAPGSKPPVLEGSFLGYVGTDPRDVRGGRGGAVADRLGATQQPVLDVTAAAAVLLQRRDGHSAHVNCIEFDAVISSSGAAAAAGRAGTPTAAAAAQPAAAATTQQVQVRVMITADAAGVICLWDCSTGRADSPLSYSLLREFRPTAFRGVPIVSMRIRPGHSTTQLLVMGQSNLLRLFDLSTYNVIRAYPNASCERSRLEAVFSPDGRFIAAGSENGLLCLWDTDSAAVIPARATSTGGQKVLLGFPSVLLAVAWSPTSHVIAMGACGLEYPVLLCS